MSYALHRDSFNVNLKKLVFARRDCEKDRDKSSAKRLQVASEMDNVRHEKRALRNKYLIFVTIITWRSSYYILNSIIALMIIIFYKCYCYYFLNNQKI